MRISNRTFLLIIGMILLISILFSCILLLTRKEETQVVVTVNGLPYGTYDLHKDQTVVITPKDNSWYNVLTIQDGTAEVTESDCANQICVYTPPLQEDLVGIIVCLPHGVAIELK